MNLLIIKCLKNLIDRFRLFYIYILNFDGCNAQIKIISFL